MGRLYSRAEFGDYEKATYSFEWGVRDDPTLEITHNDWDLQFGNGGDFFSVNMVTDDRSRLVDLGPMTWRESEEFKFEIPEPLEPGDREARCRVVEGHMYLIRTFDGNSDLAALLRVELLAPETTVDFSWKLIAGEYKGVGIARIREQDIGLEWATSGDPGPGVITGSVTTSTTFSTPSTPSTPEPKPRVMIGNNGADGGKSDGPATGIATLYCNDPLSSSWSFKDDEEGHVFQDHMVKNGGSDISFNGYAENSFSVGIEGGVQGAIIDLGSADSLQKKFGYSETVSGGQGFASIRMEGGGFVILKDYGKQTTQPLTEANYILGDVTGTCASAPVHDGHIYLMRLTDRHEPNFERIVKFKVIAYRPGESVTLRWVGLLNKE